MAINKKLCSWLAGIKPVILMVIVQMTFAGVNILYKLAGNDGMNLQVLVAYRYIFAAAFISPFAFFLERKSRPKLTWTVLGQAFLCGLFGGSLLQNLYVQSIKLTSATFASALANLVPAVTFILGVSFRLEKLSLNTLPGRAKILGTILGISGAMLLTFYKGVEIKLWSVTSHLIKNPTHVAVHSRRDTLIGSLEAVAGCFSFASWLIVQTKMSQGYPCYYSSTALTSIMGAIQAVVFAVCVERDWSEWKLGWNVRLLAAAYTGIVASGMSITLVAWCIRLKGPLFVSVFNPLMVIIVVVAGTLILNEKLYLGSVLGGLLIVLGLYGVVWGKGKEMKKMGVLVPATNNMDSDTVEVVTSSNVEEEREVNYSIKKPDGSDQVNKK